jgi:hypothetical protein
MTIDVGTDTHCMDLTFEFSLAEWARDDAIPQQGSHWETLLMADTHSSHALPSFLLYLPLMFKHRHVRPPKHVFHVRSDVSRDRKCLCSGHTICSICRNINLFVSDMLQDLYKLNAPWVVVLKKEVGSVIMGCKS